VELYLSICFVSSWHVYGEFYVVFVIGIIIFLRIIFAVLFLVYIEDVVINMYLDGGAVAWILLV
jgi:hypothetical protein